MIATLESTLNTRTKRIPSIRTLANTTLGRRQSKTSIISANVDQKSLETEFSSAICRPTGDKSQSRTLFLTIFNPRSSIVESIFDCHLPGVITLADSCGRERSGSVVKCLTRDRKAAGSSLTGVTVLWSLSKTHLS